MIYFIFPFDWGLFWGNQALTVGPVLWLSCLHSSAGDMLTLRRAETKSRAALKVWTVFGSELWGRTRQPGQTNGVKTGWTKDRKSEEIKVEYTVVLKEKNQP